MTISPLNTQQPLDQKKLGILGDGQLGRMLAEAAKKLGIYVKILTAVGKESSAGAVADECVMGKLKNTEEVAGFAIGVDAVIPEIEHIDVSGLGKTGQAPMYPSPAIVSLIQNKYCQKEAFSRFGIPLGKFSSVSDKAGLGMFGFPCMLKSKKDAFDGRGNYVLKTPEDPEVDAWIAQRGGFEGIYIEEWQDYASELAVIVVGGQDGKMMIYPVTETIQRDNICFVTETPANIEELSRRAADELARNVVLQLGGIGVFGVEMFLLKDGTVLLNEVAPRVHNSGHYTLNACETSQFENHVRVALGKEIGATTLTAPHAIMYNLLGEKEGQEGQDIVDERIRTAAFLEDCFPYDYHKAGGVKPKRKVGHINILATNAADARAKLGAIDPSALALLEKVSPLSNRIRATLDTPGSMGSRVVTELAS